MPELSHYLFLLTPILPMTAFAASPAGPTAPQPASQASDANYEILRQYVHRILQQHTGGSLPDLWPLDHELIFELSCNTWLLEDLEGEWCGTGFVGYMPLDASEPMAVLSMMPCWYCPAFPPPAAFLAVRQHVEGQLTPGEAQSLIAFYPNSLFAEEIHVFPISRPGNFPDPERFCIATSNSTGSPARIEVQGSTSLSANDLVLRAGPVPDRIGLFILGTEEVQLPFGDGFRCAGGSLLRLAVEQASQGWLVHAVDFTDPIFVGSQITWGSTRAVQAWYRDPAASGAGFNLSDALRLTFDL